MGHRVNCSIVLVFVSFLLAGLVLTASAQTATGPIEPGAGGWRTWVLASGKELRLAPPPDAQATATELQELRTLAGQRDVATLERIRYWDFWSPAHRWNELLTDTRVAQNLFSPDGLRAFAMLNVAIYDALIALDETTYAETVPVGPGLWQGKAPIGIEELRRWKPLVLASASQFRPGPPPAPDSPARAAEIAEVKNFKRTPVTNAKALYWQFGQYGMAGLLYRLSDETGRQLAEAGLDRNAPRAARAYALVHAAYYDAYIASQDAKYHYWTARPNQFDPSITTVVPNPPFPSYVSNAGALGMASALVLGHLFPREANRYQHWAQEFGESRIWAGIHFRSDVEAGWELGRRVGAVVIERATHDGAERQQARAQTQ
jgi:hypothetical protein